jgi:hypothetical protein
VGSGQGQGSEVGVLEKGQSRRARGRASDVGAGAGPTRKKGGEVEAGKGPGRNKRGMVRAGVHGSEVRRGRSKDRVSDVSARA